MLPVDKSVGIIHIMQTPQNVVIYYETDLP